MWHIQFFFILIFLDIYTYNLHFYIYDTKTDFINLKLYVNLILSGYLNDCERSPIYFYEIWIMYTKYYECHKNNNKKIKY